MILKKHELASVLVVLELTVFTGCLSTQSEQDNFLQKDSMPTIVPLVVGIGNPFVGGLLRGYGKGSKAVTPNKSPQSVHQ